MIAYFGSHRSFVDWKREHPDVPAKLVQHLEDAFGIEWTGTVTDRKTVAYVRSEARRHVRGIIQIGGRKWDAVATTTRR